MNPIIPCAQYDFFEIACLHHYQIEITLINGEIITGVAHNIIIVKSHTIKQEVLELTQGTQTRPIPLNHVLTMRALKPNPHFNLITVDH